MNALTQAINILGSQSALAKAIGKSQQTVNNWISRGAIPAEHCPLIERATGGAVRCEDLRPDVEWSVLRHQEVVAA
jgi:DNA-binding transcriptional regulator YdaS (Cro superfamily)